MTTETQVLPLIHMNGNDGERLLKQYRVAMRSIAKSREDLSDIEFHMRDYYPMGEEACRKARSQREVIFQKMRDIEKYLEEHAFNISEQIK